MVRAMWICEREAPPDYDYLEMGPVTATIAGGDEELDREAYSAIRLLEAFEEIAPASQKPPAG